MKFLGTVFFIFCFFSIATAQFIGGVGSGFVYDDNALRQPVAVADIVLEPSLSLGYRWTGEFTSTKLKYSGQGSILMHEDSVAYVTNALSLTHRIQLNHRDILPASMPAEEPNAADEISVLLSKLMEELDSTDYPANAKNVEDPDSLKDDVLERLLKVSDKLDAMDAMDESIEGTVLSTLKDARSTLVKAYGQSAKLNASLGRLDALLKKVNAYNRAKESEESGNGASVFDMVVSPHSNMGGGTLPELEAADIILPADRGPLDAIATADILLLGASAGRRANASGSVDASYDNNEFEAFGECTHFFSEKSYGVATYTIDRTSYNDYAVATNLQHHLDFQWRGYAGEKWMFIGELGYAVKRYDDTSRIEPSRGKNGQSREVATPKPSLLMLGAGAFYQASVTSVVGFTLYHRSGAENRLLDSVAAIAAIAQDPFSYKTFGIAIIYRQKIFAGIDANFSLTREDRSFGAPIEIVRTRQGNKNSSSRKEFGNSRDDKSTIINALFLRSFDLFSSVSLDLDTDITFERNNSSDNVYDYADLSVAFGVGLSW